MPPKSESQRRLMEADKRRAEQGKPTRTGMSLKQLREYLGHGKPKPRKRHGLITGARG